MNLYHLKQNKFGNKITVNGLKVINRFLVLFFIYGACFADSGVENDFNYLNKLRLSTQLKPFIWNKALANAAQNHSEYLSFNNRHGHQEQQSLKHYTGEWASDRAIFEQYPNRLVGENVTLKSGEKLYYNPINSLMSAIYHRFGFLDLNLNEIGIGRQLGDLNAYVYVMGNSELSAVCQQPNFIDNGAYNYQICIDSDKRIDKKLVDQAKKIHQKDNAKFVLWPANNARNVTPVFYQESPDPLPHHDVSGYPISIQFNPAFYKTPPKIIAFKVQASNLTDPIEAITIMNENNDPNHKFTSYQHAFFPTHRLNWDTTYSVNVEYINQDNKQHQKISWSFHTKSFQSPMINITRPNQKVKVTTGQSIILYFPPKNVHDVEASVRTRDYNMRLKVNYIDKNTLKVFVSQSGKAEINFHNKTVELHTK